MLERAKEFLQTAELALEKELYNGCAANCYYALFWATISAMKHQGFKQEKWSHGGLKQKFTEVLIHKRHIYPAHFGTWLTQAYAERLNAHYEVEGAGVTDTKRVLKHTREFINKVEEVTSK